MNSLGLGVVVSMKDAFSRNAHRIQSSMSALDQTVESASVNMQRNLGRIQKGTMMIGAGLSMLAIPTALVASTAATQKALGELASLGVKDLHAIEMAAQQFTNEWAGSSKAEFITAAYDVRSALSGLSDEAVGSFSQMAALTAKATKATTSEMVGTFTTAYGIFKPLMSDLTDMEWAQQFSGAMAQTVAGFKTNGVQMADAIKNIGAVAAASNVPLEEQLAILGQLQTTMPGSEAGTLYKAFIMKAAKAGEELGLEFIDSTGRLKSVIPILEEVKSKFPDLSQAAAQVELKKAFGSDEAVKFLLQMSQGMDSLGENIDSIRSAMRQGTAVTLEMARVMNADIGARFTLLRQQVQNLSEILGATLLPVVTPVMEAASRFVLRLQSIAQNAPTVTRNILTMLLVVGALATAVGAVTAGVGTIGIMLPAIKAGLFALSIGAGSAAAAIGVWFLPIIAGVALLVGGVYLLKRAWQTNFGGIQDVVFGAWNRVKLVFEGIRQLVTSLSNGTGQLSADVATQLQAMGLLQFVITVFRVYYRTREFLSALWQAFAGSFGAIRQMLEPTVQALFSAFRELGAAVGMVFQALTSGERIGGMDFWQALGTAVGTTFGVLAKVAAIVIRLAVQPIILLARTLRVAIQVVHAMGAILVPTFLTGARAVAQFFIPVRILFSALRHGIAIIATLWSVLRGDLSIIDGLRRVGRSAGQFLASPFLWARDIVVGVFASLASLPRRLYTIVGIGARSAITLLQGLPVVSVLKALLRGALAVMSPRAFFSAGRGIVGSIAGGIRGAASLPGQLLGGIYTRLFSSLSSRRGDFIRGGQGLVGGLATGMLRVISWPPRVFLSGLSTLWTRAVEFIPSFGELGGRIISVLTQPFRLLGSLVSGALNGMLSLFPSFTTHLQGIWERLSSGPIGFVQTLLSVFSGILTPLLAPFSTLSAAVSGIWSSLGEGVDSFIGSLMDRFAQLTGRVGEIAGVAKKAFGWLFGNKEAVPEVPLRQVAEEPAPALPSPMPLEELTSPVLVPEETSIQPPELDAAPALSVAPPEVLEAPTLSAPPPPSPPRESPAPPASSWAEAERGLTRLLSRLQTLVEAAINRIQGMGTAAARQVGASAAMAVMATSTPVVAAPNVPHVERVLHPAPVLPDMAVLPRALPSEPGNAPVGNILPSEGERGLDLRPLARSIRLEGQAGRMVSQVETVGEQAVRFAQNPTREIRQTADAALDRGTRALQPIRVEPMEGLGLAIDPGQALRTFAHDVFGSQPVRDPFPEAEAAPQLPRVESHQSEEESREEPAQPAVGFGSTADDRHRAQLLGETRGALAPASPGLVPEQGDDPSKLSRLLETLIAEVRASGDRPVNLTITTKLDGREIAQSVYKDLRERKIRNYDTL